MEGKKTKTIFPPHRLKLWFAKLIPEYVNTLPTEMQKTVFLVLLKIGIKLEHPPGRLAEKSGRYIFTNAVV